MSDPQKITSLIKTEGKTRIYQMDDGSIETRQGGTVSWRNNNPGNLKFEYAGSADQTVNSSRTKDQALTAAQGRYQGVVALDQWGNAIFETESAGRAAKAQLLQNMHGDKTIPEMLRRYAVDDYSGQANTDAYARSVYKVGDAQGVDLRGKKIQDLSSQEFDALLDGMKKVEGFKEGTVTRTLPQQQSNVDTQMLPPEQEAARELDTARADVSAPALTLPQSLSPASRQLVSDSTQAVSDVVSRHGLPWDQGMVNTSYAVAAHAGAAGVSRINLFHTDGQIIRAGQYDGISVREVTLDAATAANTPQGQSEQQLRALDAQKESTPDKTLPRVSDDHHEQEQSKARALG
ncbi:hypothetical protein [Ottowia sp.]|uniref:hypothetical protein n=1 Tax=Ottowia sp. TaxID=1898956 RepID=UPI003A89E0F2